MKLISDDWLPKVEPGEFRPTPAMIKNWTAKSGTYETDTKRFLAQLTAEHERRCAEFVAHAGGWDNGWLLPFREEIRLAIEKPEISRILLFRAAGTCELRPVGRWLRAQ